MRRYKMNKQETRDKINSITRWVAYRVYSKAGEKGKFVKAYDKLNAKVLIDHDINISDITASSENKANNVFDVLGEKELQMVLESAQSLQKMYNEALEYSYV